MARRIGSILEEISKCAATRCTGPVLESRADHVITSASNLLQTIRDSCETDAEYDILMKRFLLAIKSGDPSKFTKALRKK